MFLGSADILRRELLAAAIGLGADVAARGVGWMEQFNPPRSPGVHQPLSQLLANQTKSSAKARIVALARKAESIVHPFFGGTVPLEKVGPPVSREEYIRFTREAVVTIGINRVPSARRSNWKPLRYSRLRDIEAPMMGACYLTEWTEGIPSLYELGSEVESYRTPDELCWKLLELQSDPERRKLMSARAQSRVLSDPHGGAELRAHLRHAGSLEQAMRVELLWNPLAFFVGDLLQLRVRDEG